MDNSKGKLDYLLRIYNKEMIEGFSLFMKDSYGYMLDRYSYLIRTSPRNDSKEIIEEDFKFHLNYYSRYLFRMFWKYNITRQAGEFTLSQYVQDARACLGIQSGNKALNISFKREVIREEDATVYTVCLEKSYIYIYMIIINASDVKIQFDFHWKILESIYRTTDSSQFIGVNLDNQVIHKHDISHSSSYRRAIENNMLGDYNSKAVTDNCRLSSLLWDRDEVLSTFSQIMKLDKGDESRINHMKDCLNLYSKGIVKCFIDYVVANLDKPQSAIKLLEYANEILLNNSNLKIDFTSDEKIDSKGLNMYHVSLSDYNCSVSKDNTVDFNFSWNLSNYYLPFPIETQDCDNRYNGVFDFYIPVEFNIAKNPVISKEPSVKIRSNDTTETLGFIIDIEEIVMDSTIIDKFDKSASIS